MNGWQIASKAINEPGLRIRCRKWANLMHIHFTGSVWLDEGNRVFPPSFNSGEWEIYEEPAKEPKTVTIWQPVCQFQSQSGRKSGWFTNGWLGEEKGKYEPSNPEMIVVGWIRHTVELEQGND